MRPALDTADWRGREKRWVEILRELGGIW